MASPKDHAKPRSPALSAIEKYIEDDIPRESSYETAKTHTSESAGSTADTKIVKPQAHSRSDASEKSQGSLKPHGASKPTSSQKLTSSTKDTVQASSYRNSDKAVTHKMADASSSTSGGSGKTSLNQKSKGRNKYKGHRKNKEEPKPPVLTQDNFPELPAAKAEVSDAAQAAKVMAWSKSRKATPPVAAEEVKKDTKEKKSSP